MWHRRTRAPAGRGPSPGPHTPTSCNTHLGCTDFWALSVATDPACGRSLPTPPPAPGEEMGVAGVWPELPGQVLGSVSRNLRPEQSFPFGENSHSPLVSLWHGEGLAACGRHLGRRAPESRGGQTAEPPTSWSGGRAGGGTKRRAGSGSPACAGPVSWALGAPALLGKSRLQVRGVLGPESLSQRPLPAPPRPCRAPQGGHPLALWPGLQGGPQARAAGRPRDPRRRGPCSRQPHPSMTSWS